MLLMIGRAIALRLFSLDSFLQMHFDFNYGNFGKPHMALLFRDIFFFFSTSQTNYAHILERFQVWHWTAIAPLL